MSKRLKWLLGSVAGFVALVVVAGALLWFFVLKSDAPPKVSLSGALNSLATTVPTTATPAGATPAASPSNVPASGNPGSLSGTWVPDTTQQTFVGYRVVEQLARIGANTAVGRTSGVTGQVAIEGDTVTSAKFVADMTKLKSDSDLRDGQLRNQTIQTNTYPTATFELSQPLAVPQGLAAGDAVSMTLNGKLTLHGVTRDVSIPAQAQLKNGLLVVIGSIDIKFSDYNISKPQGASVLSIEDHGSMELQLFLKRSQS